MDDKICKCGERNNPARRLCWACSSELPQQPARRAEEDSRAARGSEETAAREAIREFAERITEARWRIADCERLHAYVLKGWIERYESGLVDLLRIIPPSPPNTPDQRPGAAKV